MENFAEHIVQNLRKIMTDRGLKQAAMADFAGITASQYSKVMSGSVQLSLACSNFQILQQTSVCVKLTL